MYYTSGHQLWFWEVPEICSTFRTSEVPDWQECHVRGRDQHVILELNTSREKISRKRVGDHCSPPFSLCIPAVNATHPLTVMTWTTMPSLCLSNEPEWMVLQRAVCKPSAYDHSRLYESEVWSSGWVLGWEAENPPPPSWCRVMKLHHKKREVDHYW